jgi:NADH-quinone oxidoreductase subunit I
MEPKKRVQYKNSVERLYLAILEGLTITIKHFVKGLITPKNKLVTIQFPEQRREYSQRYRGAHILNLRPDGSTRCVSCMMCPTICPAECITIEATESADPRVEKQPVKFEIDMLRCVFCGYCVDACPEDAIIMSKQHELSMYSRSESVWDIQQLSRRPEIKKFGLGYHPYDPYKLDHHKGIH